MRSLKIHGPVLLLMFVVVFAAYGWLLTAEFWSPVDLQILREAHQLSQNPLQMFRHIGTYFNQPVLQLSFLFEYYSFCNRPAGYLAVNLFIHALNAFLAYMLVNMLLNRKWMAILAASLFALAVGSYGKIFMSVAHLESLMLAHLYLLVLYFLIRNDFRHAGRLSSPYFILGLGLFLLASLTRATSFSLLGCLLAYKFFFYKERGRRAVLSGNILILLIVGILFYAAQTKWGHHAPTVFHGAGSGLHFTWKSITNVFRYLVLMIFPVQTSALLEKANPIVVFLYESRIVIRVLLTLATISYSFFGIVFGSRAVRFFIAWTYITLLPFTGIGEQGEWLNLTHLYLTSLGFCLVLAGGSTGTFNLLKARRWRRLVPFLAPLFYAVLAVAVTYQIDAQHRWAGQAPGIVAQRAELAEMCQRPPGR